MSETMEARILQNQIEIMWTLSYLLKCAKPDLVGKAGELDRMREDLAFAAKIAKQLLEGQPLPAPSTKEPDHG